MPIIGLTGAQGTGKSTTLNALMQLEEADAQSVVRTIPGSLPREVQAEFGFTRPEEVLTSFEGIIDYQQRILSKMEVRDRKARDLINGDPRLIYVLDRSPIDVMGYLLTWTTPMIKRGEIDDKGKQVIADFVSRCEVMMYEYDRIVYFPIAQHIPFVDEAGRAGLDTQQFHDTTVSTWIRNSYMSDMVFQITTDTVMDRKYQLRQLIHEPTLHPDRVAFESWSKSQRVVELLSPMSRNLMWNTWRAARITSRHAMRQQVISNLRERLGVTSRPDSPRQS